MEKMNGYLTVEEKRQMEEIMQRAAERMKNSRGEKDGAMEFLLLHCQCESKKQMEAENSEAEEYEADVRRLLEQACSFCRRRNYGICNRNKEESEKVDKELPFG